MPNLEDTHRLDRMVDNIDYQQYCIPYRRDIRRLGRMQAAIRMCWLQYYKKDLSDKIRLYHKAHSTYYRLYCTLILQGIYRLYSPADLYMHWFLNCRYGQPDTRHSDRMQDSTYCRYCISTLQDILLWRRTREHLYTYLLLDYT